MTYLTLMVCLTKLHVCVPATLPQPYDDVDACETAKGAAISDWTEGTTFDFAIRQDTCGPGNEGGSSEHPLPAHLRDLRLPIGDDEI